MKQFSCSHIGMTCFVYQASMSLDAPLPCFDLSMSTDKIGLFYGASIECTPSFHPQIKESMANDLVSMMTPQFKNYLFASRYTLADGCAAFEQNVDLSTTFLQRSLCCV